MPAGCGELQPLDHSFNEFFKRAMKTHFSSWYAAEVKEDLDVRADINSVKIDLRASVVN